MQFITALIASLAACASALPTTGYEPSEPSGSSAPGQALVCQQNQVSACCDKKSSGTLIGVDCTPISVAIVAGILSPACSTEQKPACCEQGSQKGTFNVDAQCMFSNEL